MAVQLLLLHFLTFTTEPTESFTVPPLLRRTSLPPTLLRTNFSPDDKELAAQKFEAVRAFADFNDGVWSGTATSFSLTSDAAAGITNKSSAVYTTSLTTGIDQKGLKIRETFEIPSRACYGGGSSGSSGEVVIKNREVVLDDGVDVDSVDGSYSLDVSLLDLPSGIAGVESVVKFGVEKGIAVSDDERVRVFLLYGMDDTLLRVVLCDERREASDETEEEKGDDDDDGGKETDSLVEKITGAKTAVTSASSVEDKMEFLAEAMSKHNKKAVKVSDDDTIVARQPVSIFSLVSGVWLGDTVVRTQPTPSKGFSSPRSRRSTTTTTSSSSTSTVVKKDGFAEWSTGVQKITMTFFWDYSTTVRQRIDAGRAMGPSLDTSLPRTTMGTITSTSNRRNPKERIVSIDFDAGAYAGFIVGSVFLKAPRSLSFSSGGSTGRVNPFFTELAVFQKRSTVENDFGVGSGGVLEGGEEGVVDPPEVFCSRLTRLYGSEGKLRQGASSFFTLDRTVLGN